MMNDKECFRLIETDADLTEFEKNAIKESITKYNNLPGIEQEKIRGLNASAYRIIGSSKGARDDELSQLKKAQLFMTDFLPFELKYGRSLSRSTLCITIPKYPKALAFVAESMILTWIDNYRYWGELNFNPEDGLEIFVSMSHDCILDLLRERYPNIADKRDACSI